MLDSSLLRPGEAEPVSTLVADLVTLGSPALVTLAGSRAYGLDHADSDLDLRGAYLAPTPALLGLNLSTKHVDGVEDPTSHPGLTATPEQYKCDEPVDVVLYEAGKLIRLALGANPGVLEVLYAPVLYSSDAGAKLLAAREVFLSQRARERYIGYARSQLSRVEEELAGGDAVGRFKAAKRTKHLTHVFRLMDQGAELLRTGEIDVRVSDPESLRARASLPLDEIHDLFAEAVIRLDSIDSVLPPHPDYAAANELLLELRS